MIIQRDSRDMHEIADGQAELICTSPPYWGSQSETDLLQPRKNQQDYQRVVKDLRQYAESLKPVYEEIVRILKPGKALIFQIKDLRYGPFSVPPERLALGTASPPGTPASGKHQLDPPGAEP